MAAIPEKIAPVDYENDFFFFFISGIATIRLDIDETGKVTKAELLSFVDTEGNKYEPGSDSESWLSSLDNSLVVAALKSSFNPAVICGESVQVQQLYTFDIDP
ncbi:MAG: hypothetical protein GY771_00145 [bacterium]|nr:hypothetical protein [bacterium]